MIDHRSIASMKNCQHDEKITDKTRDENDGIRDRECYSGVNVVTVPR